MALAEFAWFVVYAIVALALLLGVVWFLLPYDNPVRCEACGARIRADLEFCPVCAAPKPVVAAHAGATTYGYPAQDPSRRVVDEIDGERDPDGSYRNKSVSRRMVVAASLAMGIGLGVRALAMLGVTVGGSGSHFVEGLITIAAGALAFVGFVFLDAA